jgi:ankyrin repeat protein
MQLLLSKGASPQLRGTYSTSALCAAAKYGHSRSVQLLVEAWGKPSVTAADLIDAAAAAASMHHMRIFARLAKELRQL